MITAPRGTVDLLPPDSRAWQALESALRSAALLYGYGEIRTPMFESTELFVRGVGETTDIVEKEMYTFTDRGGRSMTLRPEWTAPVVRALLEAKRFGQDAQKVFYIGPFFRYERPQAGRLRQAHQFGVEAFGTAGAEIDAEVIMLAVEALRAAGVQDAQLEINSIGDASCRPAYREALLAHFRPSLGLLSEDSQHRLERNPLRILDSKAAVDRPFIETAPQLLEHLCEPCSAHFSALRAYLDAAGVAYTVAPRLVRGFDYYTRTVFEISSTALGAQSALCGGGRYDGLVASLGGPATPAVGFGMGLERLLMALQAIPERQTPRTRTGLQMIALGAPARLRLQPLIAVLRRRVLAGNMSDRPAIFSEYADRKIVSHFKLGDRNGARAAVILGENELQHNRIVLRDLLTREESELSLAENEATAAAILAWYAGRTEMSE